jgi:hypothetical protein
VPHVGYTGVTVSLESEEAGLVEAANKRYAELMASRVASDQLCDAEAQVCVVCVGMGGGSRVQGAG